MRKVLLQILMLTAVTPAFAGQPGQPSSEPIYLRDRGTGVSTSMFGTYIRKNELIVYPFYEYYRDRDFEYAPEELGAVGDMDFRGRYRAHEALFFVGFGLSDNVAVEFETAVIKASFGKSPADQSGLPPVIEESGLGDVEGQIRWRWRPETMRRPEWFSYAELVVPHAKDKPLIGTPGVELKFGTGLTRGFGWGTLTARAAVDYSRSSSSPWDLGEYAVEYLRRLGPRWRIYAGLEGTQDELSLITEAQWHVLPHGFLRFNNGLGLTSKATDWTPELGVLFTLPVGR
jgi:hypothetical protein